MIGAIAGDVIGSTRENNNIKSKDFELLPKGSHPTDDSILTIALADAILNNLDYGQTMRQYYQRYPAAGYGGRFHQWASAADSQPYNSWGNGSAMRTSPVAYAYDDLATVLDKAEHYASYTHNHMEGIKGAQATAAAIYLARNGSIKADIKKYIETTFGYDLSRTIDEIRPGYTFDVSCQGSVPEAIIAFLESTDFEDAIRNAISIGGDSDTIACITGGIAEAYYGGVPINISEVVLYCLGDKMGTVLFEFYERHIDHCL